MTHSSVEQSLPSGRTAQERSPDLINRQLEAAGDFRSRRRRGTPLDLRCRRRDGCRVAGVAGWPHNARTCRGLDYGACIVRVARRRNPGSDGGSLPLVAKSMDEAGGEIQCNLVNVRGERRGGDLVHWVGP